MKVCVCQCWVEFIHRYWSTLITHLVIKSIFDSSSRLFLNLSELIERFMNSMHFKVNTGYDSLFLKGSHMMLAPSAGSDYQSMCFTQGLMKTAGLLFFRHKTQACCGRRSAVCKSRFHFQTDAAKTYKPSAAHEIWMISCRILCTKAPLWPVAHTANTDFAVQLSVGEENETRPRQEWKWPRGRVAARKPNRQPRRWGWCAWQI